MKTGKSLFLIERGIATMIDLQVMTKEEQHYVFDQSQQISMQTGHIGYLRGDLGSSGTKFYSTWNDFQPGLKTDQFKAEFDRLINSMRVDADGILKNRTALAAYCYTHPESCIDSDGRNFGFRTDTDQYAYLIRLNPYQGEYNIYCYCYLRELLDRHMEKARNGIQFITPYYKERFRIPDGDSIRITTPDGTQMDRVCRYIDDTHVEVGVHSAGDLYHICQFAELMERSGNTVIPLRSSLPKRCFSVLDSTNEIICIECGVMGYKPTSQLTDGQEAADRYNAAFGVTKAQAAAMKAGSMFGWDTPAADPKNYDEQGQPTKPKRRDERGAR